MLNLTIINEVIVGRQRLYWRRLMFLSLNGAKFRILHNQEFLDRKFGIQELLAG